MHADHKRPQSPRLITAQQLFHLLCMTTKVLSHLDRLQHNIPFTNLLCMTTKVLSHLDRLQHNSPFMCYA